MENKYAKIALISLLVTAVIMLITWFVPIPISKAQIAPDPDRGGSHGYGLPIPYRMVGSDIRGSFDSFNVVIFLGDLVIVYLIVFLIVSVIYRRIEKQKLVQQPLSRK